MRTIWLAAVVILVDQVAKITVVNSMYLGQSIPLVGDWFLLHYTENPGMAFGIEIGHQSLVTVFSIAATCLIVYYLVQIGNTYRPYRLSLTLVLGGAIGNIIDRILYGYVLYDEPLFLGRVVDFIHVDVWRGQIPDFVPVIGGHFTALFPIWNVADMAIVLGVVGIIAFQGRYHRKLAEEEQSRKDEQEATDLPGELDRDGHDAGEQVADTPVQDPG